MLSFHPEGERSADIINQLFYGKRFFKIFWLIRVRGPTNLKITPHFPLISLAENKIAGHFTMPGQFTKL